MMRPFPAFRAARAHAARLLVVAALTIAAATPAESQMRDRARIAAAVDSIVTAALAGGRAAGASVAVVRGGDTLVLRGYGKADLELDVPTPERAVYEIGSVTKQFTAAAILQLQEQGKLSLDDELTKYLPNYPTQGHRLTVRRLLDHTSGIQGYTEMPEFGPISVRKLSRDSLVALFSVKPFAFAPGEAAAYNNSAYFLLGLVIEKVSGTSYEAYIKQHLFERAGMADSHYCSNSTIVPRKAHGYDLAADGTLRRAAYMDHTWPFAAGSICSTAGDLVAWTRALHGGRILGPAGYRALLTPGTLNDGTKMRYNNGLAFDSILGHRAIHHGGDIYGYRASLAYLPDDTLTIAVLVNTLGLAVGPGEIERSIVNVVLGDRTPKGIAFRGRAADYAGEYRGIGRGAGLVLKFAADSAARLALQGGAGPARPLTYFGGETFGDGSRRYTFVREGGRVTKVRADMVSGYTIATRAPVTPPAAGTAK